MKKIGTLLACTALTLGILAGCASGAAASGSASESRSAAAEVQELQVITDKEAQTAEPAETIEAAADTENDAVTEQEPEVIGSGDDETEIVITTEEATEAETTAVEEAVDALDPDGSYTTKEDVSLYLYQYGHLPSNFITKKEAKKLGWSSGSLEPYAPGKCIGGDYFGNYEGILPDVDGEEYHECDIDTLGKKSRGAKRIIYSTDGRIYYTDDHYETFTLLYGEEK